MHRLYGFEKEIGVTSGGHLKVGPGPANHLKIPGKNSGKKFRKKIPEKFVIKKEFRLFPHRMRLIRFAFFWRVAYFG